MEPLVAELLHFPTGRHDDQVDVLSLFGRMLARMAKGLVPPKPPRPIDAKPTMNELIADHERRMEGMRERI